MKTAHVVGDLVDAPKHDEGTVEHECRRLFEVGRHPFAGRRAIVGHDHLLDEHTQLQIASFSVMADVGDPLSEAVPAEVGHVHLLRSAGGTEADEAHNVRMAGGDSEQAVTIPSDENGNRLLHRGEVRRELLESEVPRSGHLLTCEEAPQQRHHLGEAVHPLLGGGEAQPGGGKLLLRVACAQPDFQASGREGVHSGRLACEERQVPERRVQDECPEAQPVARVGGGDERCKRRPGAKVVGHEQDIELHGVDAPDSRQPRLEAGCRLPGDAAKAKAPTHVGTVVQVHRTPERSPSGRVPLRSDRVTRSPSDPHRPNRSSTVASASGQTSMSSSRESVLEDLPGPRLRRADLRGLELVTHLLRTAAEHPEPLVTHAVESFFAPHMNTVGCVGVRGAPFIRQVLTNGDDFAPLEPNTDDLPADVQSLSRGVFTFHGTSHGEQRSVLREAICLDAQSKKIIRSAAKNAIGGWRGQELDLAEACRRVARDVLGAVLFGPGDQGRAIARAVSIVVDARRSRRLASMPMEHSAARHQLVDASRSLAVTLEEWLSSRRRRGLLAGLGEGLDKGPARTLAVAQATAICAASTEPTAASLGWAVLALTQRPDLQAAIRTSTEPFEDVPESSTRGSPSVLDRVLLESQRLLPSSAIVTRMTLRPVEVAGRVLPERCEVMISSLLAHRDGARFSEPRSFSPDRWIDLRVSPFEFFPFGSGVRACLGASVARAVLRTTVAELVMNAMVSLPFDTRVGWQMPDALVPGPGVRVIIGPAAISAGGRALGPISELVRFDDRHP